MDESEENISAEDIPSVDSPMSVKIKPKKRSLVERELETNLTARVTSPATSEGTNTSRYGRARRIKTIKDLDMEKMKPLKIDVSKTQPQAYKMHASNSPIRKESPKRAISVASSIEDQIENIYNENISLSRFGSEEKAKSQSPAKKFSKVYIRKDLIQKPDTDTVVLIKNMFSPNKPNSHLNNILERSSEKYSLNGHGQAWNGFPDTSSVVKTLDFDGKKKKKDVNEKVVSKNDLFVLEASCEYQVGDLAWARVGTYPFWPCIVTREPISDMFVKKKLFGRIEHAIIHVTFFGDNGRRGWIVDNMLRKYHGRAEFESSRNKFTPEDKKKDPRLYAAHFVSEKKLPLWNVSVDEAETLMKEPKRLRIDILYDMLEKSRAAKTTPKREKGGKITRTDSDVSLSESLYDTLFSEDDGKADDSNRSKKARNKSLDVSEVVTACLDNMAAKSGIIQIQRQSHMDRWLQKAKSKTPEKMQPKLQVKVKKEKRKDRVKKVSKEGKRPHKLRKNESLSSDTNLLPYQNEHDYSSVNYENHDINDSSNKNADSVSGHNSTLDTSDIDIVIKVESLSSSMEDFSQDDIITTVVNDDILISEPENLSKDVNDHQHKIDTDRINDKVENNNEHNLEICNENDQIEIKVELPFNNSDLENGVPPRRSKRKRQTCEGLNNSITENKVKEPKLDLVEQKTYIDETPVWVPSGDEIQDNNNTLDINKDSESIEKKVESKKSTALKLEVKATRQSKLKTPIISFNSNCKPVVVIEPLKLDGLENHIRIKESNHFVQNKWFDSVIKDVKNFVNSLETKDVSSTVGQNENDSIVLKNDTNTSQENIPVYESIKNMESKGDSNFDSLIPDMEAEQDQDNVSIDCQQPDAKNPVDSERMEIDCSTPVTVEEEKSNNFNLRTIISETDADHTVQLAPEKNNKTAEGIELPSVQENSAISNENNAPKVVIGEDTFFFDRTLSQDYDEIDTDRCDEENDLPAVSSFTEVDKSKIVQNNSSGHEERLLQDYCKDKKTTSDTDSTDLIQYSNNCHLSTIDDCGSFNKCNEDINISNDSRKISNAITKSECNSDVGRDFTFLDKGNANNDTTIVTVEDNKPSIKGDVSTLANEEQNKVSDPNTDENITKCVFLDQNIETIDAKFNNSKERNRKSPRLSLKKPKNHTLTFNKKCDNSQNSHIDSVENTFKSDLESTDPETASINSDDSKVHTDRSKGYSKEKQDVNMNNPEFIKYLEIRQDALVDEHPDLTENEIVTYLYQNWLYEEGNKSDLKKTDDIEQSNIIKGLDHDPAPQMKKIRKKPKSEKEPKLKNVDIREMMHKEKRKWDPDESEFPSKHLENVRDPNNYKDLPGHDRVLGENIRHYTDNSNDNPQSIDVSKLNDIDDFKTSEKCKAPTGEIESRLENNVIVHEKVSANYLEMHKSDASNKDMQTLSNIADSKTSEELINPTNENSLTVHEENNVDFKIKISEIIDIPISDMESIEINKPNNVEDSKASEDLKTHIDDLGSGSSNVDLIKTNDNKGSKESSNSKINGFLEHKEIPLESITNDEFEPETASIKSEGSGVSITKRKGRPKEKQDLKRAMDDPEFIKYLEARQDALIDEQPDLTQDEIVTYLYQTWFYEESTKSDQKKTDETEQSNLVRGLNQEPAPQPRKYKKKSKSEKDPELKNVLDIRHMMQKDKPKRKATQSKPYYNEEDSDLEEEDLETFKIFERDEQNEDGEEIDEVELYFEQLTKPKPNVFKGFARERVCEVCEKTGDLVKCKSCHGTFHVDCVKKEAQVIEVAVPTRGRKKKRGRKPKGYDMSLLDSESQSDERSQDANNSEELNMSIEDEPESHIVVDAENFETQWELKMKELQIANQEDYASDQEINWQVEPGQCEIVDVKHKEKPIDYSDYRCNNCLKYETPVCFVCQSDKSPKAQTEVRQKCQVAHCHRYYHLECLDHWPQTQFNSWEPSKTNKKEIEYIEALSCPRHVCHTCVSDDPRGCKTRFSGDKLARCVKCPATYHSYTKCLPAGTQILTGSQIICPRHYEHRPGKVPCHVNTGWCFICALGGTLICCEYCPTSFHAECLNIKPPEGSYMCEDCETGRLPLYGEMVWVKLGHYRWWPGIVLHPTEIPDNIMAVKHSPGEFVVRFFGQYDHYWVNRGRVFPFQEGDSGRISSQKSKIDAAFTTAMEHAQRACEILKNMQPNEEEDMDIASSLLPPHYVKLKTNKPLGSVARRDLDANSLTQCDCDPDQPDPCGPYSHCLNRMLLTECGPQCRAGERCNNRAFERRLYPRLAAYRTPARGWGLRTLEDIKQGQFVIEYVGELIDMEEFRRRMCRKHEIRDENFYFLTLDKERMIDAGPKGNLARFMNHCCEPNCETQKWTVLGDVRVGLFALRDIPANSEVTFNYNLECAGIEKKRCLCGAKRCSGYIGAKPKQLQDDLPKKVKPPAKRTYKKRKPTEDPSTSKKIPKIKIKPIKPRELTEIEKDLLIIKNATNGMSSDSEGSRLSSVDERNPKALKRKLVSFSTEEASSSGKKAKLTEDSEVLAD